MIRSRMTNSRAEQLASNAAIEHEPEYAQTHDAQTGACIDLIVSMVTPDCRDIARRAALNLYRIGRTHQVLDDLAEMKQAGGK